MDSNNILTFVMLAVLVLLVLFMFRNSRKRQRAAQELQEKVAPGAEVMTNFGVFGTIVSIDTDDNKVVLETGPGATLTVHRQTIARVIDPVEAIPAVEEAATESSLEEPEFGQRVDIDKDDDTKSS